MEHHTDCIKNNPIVSLSAVSRCTPVFEENKNNFTEYFHSAIALGKAEIVMDDEEKIEIEPPVGKCKP